MNPMSPDPLPDDLLDELLGLDPAPRLSAGAVARLRAGLRDADEAALDGLLALDEVSVPGGLAARIKRSVRSRAPGRRALRAVPLAAALAAAAAVLVLTLRGDRAAKGQGAAAAGAPAPQSSALVPSDELLAALPILDDVEFLVEDLDPFEAEALFLFDEEDEVLLDLVSDAGLLEDER